MNTNRALGIAAVTVVLSLMFVAASGVGAPAFAKANSVGSQHAVSPGQTLQGNPGITPKSDYIPSPPGLHGCKVVCTDSPGNWKQPGQRVCVTVCH